MSNSKFSNEMEYFSHLVQQQTTRTEPKPVVHFETIPGLTVITPGYRCRVVPSDHPAGYLNGEVVTTSIVVKANEDGSFETANTIYVPKLDK